MKFFKTLFWFGLLLIPLAIAFALLQSVEKTALVAESQSLTAPRVERAKALLREHDPRRLKDQETKTIVVSEQELSLVANHLIQRVSSGGATVSLSDNTIVVQASLAIPGLQPAYYVNVDTALSTAKNRLAFEHLKIGKLRVPNRVASALGEFVMMHAYRSADIPASNDLIKAIDVSPKRLAVTYQWQENLIAAVRDRLVPAATVARLKRYNDALVLFGNGATGAQTLTQIVRHLANTAMPDDDYVADNRAMIISLSNYVNGRRMSALIPEVEQWPTPKRIKITAHGRKDLAQHFATSAALAVTGGSEISDAIGLYKEIDDSDGGSGFSFKDLAADRAGTQFAELATASTARAQAVREQLMRLGSETGLVPELGGLEENMRDAVFKARYGGIEDKRYLDVVAEIDRRIKAGPLFSP